MKRTFVVLLFFSLFLNVIIAQNQPKHAVAKILFGEKTVAELAALGVEVDHGEYIAGRSLTNVFSELEIQQIRDAGFEVKIIIPDYLKDYQTRDIRSRTVECTPLLPNYPYKTPENYRPGSMGGYFSYEELLANLDSMAAKYPQLMSLRAPIDTFKSIEGEPLYWFRVSDNPNSDENEPEVLYTALHHAREPGSLSQLIFYLWYLLENYATDPEVNFLVNNTEMYFVPCVNPDGYRYNQSTNPDGGGLWRKNRRNNGDGTFGVDLNRNYGYQWGFDNSGSSPNGNSETFRGKGPFSEPETATLKAFCDSREFQLALNYHTQGNLLVYPWGYSDRPSDDSTTFRIFAAAMAKQNNFKAGTGTETVGYVVNGDSDDWMYGEQVTKPLIYSMTPEVGNNFWQNPEDIDFYNRSTQWMNLATAHLVHHFGWARDKSEHRISQTTGNLKFELTRSGLKNGDLEVRLDGLSPDIIATGNPKTYQLDFGQTVLDSIAYDLHPNIAKGTELIFLLSVNKGTISWQDTLRKIFTGERMPIFTDDGESFGNWANVSNGTWGVNTRRFYSAPSCIGDSPAGNYSNSTTNTMTLKTPFSLKDALAAKLEFFGRWDIERGFDYTQIMASRDGINFSPLCGKYTRASRNSQIFDQPIYDGIQPNWVEEEIDLADFLGTDQVYLRFRLVSDRNDVGDGFNFDNLEVNVKTDESSGSVNLDDSDFTFIKISPNPAKDVAEIELFGDANKVAVYDVFGKLVFEKATEKGGKSAFPVNVSNWQSGVYVVKIEHPGEGFFTKKWAIVR